MLKRFFIALAVLLSIIAVIFYYKLGGSKPLKFEITSQPKLYVLGQHFEGKYNSPEIEKLFYSARERAETKNEATLTILNFDQDKKNIVSQFIGTSTTTKPRNVPNHLELKILPDHKAVSTTIKAHNAVMPTAESVLSEAKEFAKDNGYIVDTVSIETYVSDRELQISFPLQNK